MNDSLLNHFSLKKIHEHRQWLASPSTEIGDSGVASRLTPSSSTSDHQLNIHSSDANHEENDRRFSTLNGDSSLYTPVPIEKPQLRYKRGTENMHYSHCLVTFLDHASAIFIQIPADGRAFQQMHQDMNQYYMDRLNECDTIRTSWFHVGDFCVAYSTRYCEYFRARILNIDHQNRQCLVVYVDFGNSEWVNIKGIRLLDAEFTQLEAQGMPVTLSHIVPKKDLNSGRINWESDSGKQCTRKLRRLLMKPDDEPFLFVSVTFLPHDPWWPLPFVAMKIDGQDLAEILHRDGLARLTRTNKDLRRLYPHFGTHPNEQLVFGLQQSERVDNRLSTYG